MVCALDGAQASPACDTNPRESGNRLIPGCFAIHRSETAASRRQEKRQGIPTLSQG
jgi:hypothetical protein